MFIACRQLLENQIVAIEKGSFDDLVSMERLLVYSLNVCLHILLVFLGRPVVFICISAACMLERWPEHITKLVQVHLSYQNKETSFSYVRALITYSFRVNSFVSCILQCGQESRLFTDV